jgi:hypothetical protein
MLGSARCLDKPPHGAWSPCLLLGAQGTGELSLWSLTEKVHEWATGHRSEHCSNERSHHLVKPPTTHSTNREPNELEQKKGGRKIDEN